MAGGRLDGTQRPRTARRRPSGHRPGIRMSKRVEEKERVVIRFAGDSGDGMQLAGGRFTNATAILGNDLATLPDFPAEIRAPAGTVHGEAAAEVSLEYFHIMNWLRKGLFSPDAVNYVNML